jgi:tetratricopeptide (TPR) repeat protein
LGAHPEWQRARNYLAENLVAQERLQDAKSTLREGIEVDRTSPARWANLARFLFIRLHELEEAKDAFEESIRLDGKRPSVWISYANVLKQLGKPAEKAIHAARRAVDLDPTNADNWLALADVCSDYGEFEQAEGAFEKATGLDESSPRSWFEFGMFLQDIPGRLPEAESALQRALASSERYPCMVPKELAALLIHKGADESAKPLLREAVEINKECYCSLTLLAGIESRAHRTADAKQYFDRALAVNPRGITAITGLAQLAIEQDSGGSEAPELIDRAMATNAQDPRVFLARALLNRSQRAMQACLADLRRALEIDPDFVEAKVILAMVEAHQGEVGAAISHLTDAMRWLDRRRELLSGLVDAAVELARRGHGDLVAHAIRETSALEYLEPLHIALQLLKGEKPLVAKEVAEVAADIVSRIRAEKPDASQLRS